MSPPFAARLFHLIKNLFKNFSTQTLEAEQKKIELEKILPTTMSFGSKTVAFRQFFFLSFFFFNLFICEALNKHFFSLQTLINASNFFFQLIKFFFTLKLFLLFKKKF